MSISLCGGFEKLVYVCVYEVCTAVDKTHGFGGDYVET
jgi:hypothetical protein